MIRGYFSTRGQTRRPFINGLFEFPDIGRSLQVRLLVDTGADRTILGPLDARRLAIDHTIFPDGQASIGVGGRAPTRVVNGVLTLDTFTTGLPVALLEAAERGPMLSIPSLLGRDVLSRFALFVEERTQRVLLLQPEEADGLGLP